MIIPRGRHEYPGYIDAYLRLAASAKAQNNLPLAIELVNEALKVDDKNPNALSLLGELELKNDDWVKAKETFRAANDATDGKDSYAILSLGNWNYFAAMRNEKRNPKLEATHLEKAKELYTKVLTQHNSNMYAANGSGIILAEKGQFDIAKDLFTQVQEAASGSVFRQMPDVWVNLAHVYFAQGNFALAVKMYQNCFAEVLLQHRLSNSSLLGSFDLGAVMQKSSSSTLQKKKRTADEVRSTVTEAENAVRVFTQLSGASDLHVHGFDSKKIQTHVQYCTHLLEGAKVHREAAEREELQNRQRLEVARQAALAEEARRKAEEHRKYQLEKRKQEDELRRLKQEEEKIQRIKDDMLILFCNFECPRNNGRATHMDLISVRIELKMMMGKVDPVSGKERKVPASVVRRRRALSSSDEEGELMEGQANSSPQRENSPVRQEESNVEEEDANLEDDEEAN
ncbi:unnamed protein product [Thlaspi arvense]|uniref:Uncharacterized protein n=1 Tax=Thlaspi arvense TaxID=13288 RepID=A0AAU9RVT1_THLAR|nr:unnamed protein product [Thlaspi arvense]